MRLRDQRAREEESALARSRLGVFEACGFVILALHLPFGRDRVGVSVQACSERTVRFGVSGRGSHRGRYVAKVSGERVD
jgi:hypothetical protein